MILEIVAAVQAVYFVVVAVMVVGVVGVEVVGVVGIVAKKSLVTFRFSVCGDVCVKAPFAIQGIPVPRQVVMKVWVPLREYVY